MSESLSQGVSRKGRKKALLIAVMHVMGIDIPLPHTHDDVQEFKKLLIDQYGYAEDDIVMLVDNRQLHKSFLPSEVNILKKIQWLVEDVGEHDRLAFYYSGHGGQTICHHDSEVDGQDEAIYEHNGGKIIDNVLKQHLVEPVLKAKGCQLFAVFDCCHSGTILDLKHSNCCFPSPSPVKPVVTSSQQSDMDASRAPLVEKWSWLSKKYHISLPLPVFDIALIGLVNRVMLHLHNHAARILKVFLSSTPPCANEINGSVQTAPSRPPVSVDTGFVPQSRWLTSPHRTAMSPISMYPNARCNGTCVMTAEEENQGRVVCLSACKDSEEAHDDNMTGATFTKFLISSLRKNSSISYRGLLDNVKSQVADLEQTRLAVMWRKTFGRFPVRRKQFEVTSESSINRKGLTQEPRDWDKKVSI
ncbi:peptidase C14, caspase domain-containing protein [Suillus discolor]|uniref:Peptidase C14, caspase domain-containing protein n=1 Tax=Suillus discolor TaxID=1912936 RepID=A0A9P7FIV6_9AGAM|nr:peptidase C14, caspase domain-containing protein [Suillus discolor]KAG2117275.1 peptidase C14, caspase domain-containing protein [Suillus discolor]